MKGFLKVLELLSNPLSILGLAPLLFYFRNNFGRAEQVSRVLTVGLIPFFPTRPILSKIVLRRLSGLYSPPRKSV